MTQSNKSLSVVIPVYRSADCLPELLKQLAVALPGLAEWYEVILVNDASPDNSWDVVLRLQKQYPFVRGIDLMRNVGQAKATLCGLSHASGDIIIMMDDDLQHRPSELPKFIDALNNHLDIDCVFASFEKKHHAGYRNIGSRVLAQINQNAYGLDPDIRASSFCAMRGEVKRAIVSHQTMNPAIAALIYGTTRRIMNVSIQHSDRYTGESNYTFGKQLKLAWDNICYVGMLPLRIVSVVGFLSCSLSLLLFASFVYRYMTNQTTVAGWTTVVSLVSLFSGIILLSLGSMGEYIIRILREVRGAPRYIIRSAVGFPPKDTISDVMPKTGYLHGNTEAKS